jgi:hypothetical protein
MRYLVQSGKCCTLRVYYWTIRGLRFLSQNLLRTGNGDAGAAFPDILYEDDHDLLCRLIRNQNIRLPLKGD